MCVQSVLFFSLSSLSCLSHLSLVYLFSLLAGWLAGWQVGWKERFAVVVFTQQSSAARCASECVPRRVLCHPAYKVRAPALAHRTVLHHVTCTVL